MKKKLLPSLFSALLLMSGCAMNTTITNLTPSQQFRTTNNLYAVEVEMTSDQQSMRWDSVQAQALVGNEVYKMTPTPLISNRWEGFIPVPAGSTSVRYQYKFYFDYNSFGPAKHDSAVSRDYALHIMDQ